MADNVKVAVRVRPFNERENQRNCEPVVSMSGNSTTIKGKDGSEKRFTYDYSYWSHDGFRKLDNGYMEPDSPTSQYADQKKVFDDLGRGILDNAWKGYNSTLFAYGQTGSGKTYSIFGYKENKGVIPIFCDELFNQINEELAQGADAGAFPVSLSMLEIYNEVCVDLMISKSKQQGLKIKEVPNKGFVAVNLSSHPVSSYAQIEEKINFGTRNKTVAATQMNQTSSRAHTIVAITFLQKSKSATGTDMTRTSVVNLVDLAGSERIAKTGAEGDRLKEGANINKSLFELGNVIEKLARGDKKVNFRNSVLTRLLRNALGGNSKTIMIAALSPADDNYSETLSTLRFADRAKSIKTKAEINESPTDKLIRELREENARLLKLIKEGGIRIDGAPGGGDTKALEEMKSTLEAELQENQKQMEAMEMSWQQRLQEAQAENEARMAEERQREENKKTIPHLWNLNEDQALSGMLLQFFREDAKEITIGNNKASQKPDIVLSGLGIQPEHAVVRREGNSLFVKPVNESKILVNGSKIKGEVQIHHNDRILFGANNLYVFHLPSEAAELEKKGQKMPTPTFDGAQEEIAVMAGLVTKTLGESSSKWDTILRQEVGDVLRIVNEANAMSEEMDKKVKFEVLLVSPQFLGRSGQMAEVMVKMRSLTSSNEWAWSKSKALNRQILMQELYQSFLTNEVDWDVPKEQDPFWEPGSTDVLVGATNIHLLPLSHMTAYDDDLDIHNYSVQTIGKLHYELLPSDKNGKPLGEEEVVMEAHSLIGKNIHFLVKLQRASELPDNISETWCKFKFYLDNNYTETKKISGTNPEYNFSKIFHQEPVTHQFLEYLKTGHFCVEIWGHQKDEQKSSADKTTKELMKRERTFYAAAVPSSNEAADDHSHQKHKKKKKKHHKKIAIPEEESEKTDGEKEEKRREKDKAKQDREAQHGEEIARYDRLLAQKTKENSDLKNANQNIQSELQQTKQELERLKRKMTKMESWVKKKEESGEKNIKVADVIALLDGRQVSSQSNENTKLTRTTSQACVLQ